MDQHSGSGAHGIGGKLRVLLLDDHPVLVDGLASFIEAQGPYEVVARCATVNEAIEALGSKRPQLALVDIKLVNTFTFEFVEKATAEAEPPKVVFITGQDDEHLIVRALTLGVHGYVLKSEPMDEVAKALETVARGERYYSTEMLRRYPDLKADDSERPAVKSRLDLLTRREKEILHHVSMGKTAREIASLLNISMWTVTNHKANIMAKLNIHNQVGLTRFALASGLGQPQVGSGG